MLDVLVAHATSNTHTSGTAVVRIRVISKVRSLSANVEFRPMRLTHSRGFASSGICLLTLAKNQRHRNILWT